MKKMLLVAAVALTGMQAALAQTAYSVTGTAGPDLKKVYIIDVANRFAAIDSATVSGGRFALKGSQPKDAILGIGSQEQALLFVNDGVPVEVSLEQQTLKGSAQNEKLNGYDRELTPIDTQMGDIIAKARAAAGMMPKEEMDSLGALYMALSEQREKRVMEIIAENSDNMIPVAFIDQNMAYSMSYDQLKTVCNPQNAYYDHPAMQVPRRLLENMEKRAPGKLFTDMTIPDMDGKERKLSEWLGKGGYVMIDFWASWCGPCRQEMPNVVANYAKYHEKGFEIIGISFDQKAESWKNAVGQMGMTWPQLSDLGYWKSAAAGVYGISSIPASILFDGEGKIIATDLRGEKLGEKLQEIYGF
ncbi:MAG: AhpC/TSA family protein [Prevotella sp.]|nr:AhpC/TSA family protein [Prevotella sp.]